MIDLPVIEEVVQEKEIVSIFIHSYLILFQLNTHFTPFILQETVPKSPEERDESNEEEKQVGSE